MGIFSKRRRKNSFSSSIPLLRWLGPGATTLGVLYAVYMLLTGGLSFSSLDGLLTPDPASEFRGETISLGDRTDRPADRIRVATFNIEHFADKKSSIRTNEHGVDVLGTIARIVSTFDVVAIQELQGADGIALQRLVALLNESGGSFAATMSDPIGESYLESYAFVWDRSRINLVPGSAYVVQDPGKRMYREPMVATFETVVPPDSGQPPFRFTMINVHTKPDRVDPDDQESEINVLADVFQRVRDYEFQQYSEDDFILLGDLNVSEKNLGRLKSIPGVLSLAADIQTNINRTKTNDHILIDSSVTAEYSGRRGVIDLKADLGLTEQQANAISDHIPLWAEFDLYERPPVPRAAATATASGPGTRLIQ
ncbi:deoxyribonuclease [Stieleria mannarensis]|uniref:deoxyribonuclease n=1 Tax=Stieleria mannarensis TaxID=2755585 RepID=UPI0016048441|nr:deoxyribonuclease [Rhodopirellula sp. JC639]